MTAYIGNQTDDMKHIRFLLNRLVSQTLRRAQFDLSASVRNAIVNRLSGKIWAWVSATDFEVSPDTAEYFEEVVFMELVEKLGSECLLLQCMLFEEYMNDWLIVHCFTKHLVRPKRSSVMNRVKLCLKTNWPWMLATTISAVLWVNNPDQPVYNLLYS